MKLFNQTLEQLLGRPMPPSELGHVHEVLDSELDGEDEGNYELWSTQHLNKPIFDPAAYANKPPSPQNFLQRVMKEVKDLQSLVKALVSLSHCDPLLFKGWDMQMQADAGWEEVLPELRPGPEDDRALLPDQDEEQVGRAGRRTGCGRGWGHGLGE